MNEVDDLAAARDVFLTLGWRVRAFRVRQHLSRRTAAGLIGVGEATLKRLEMDGRTRHFAVALAVITWMEKEAARRERG